jgi:hypothetical protein
MIFTKLDFHETDIFPQQPFNFQLFATQPGTCLQSFPTERYEIIMSATAGTIKEDKDYLQFYWDLASEDATIRLAACDKLVKYLQDDIALSNDAKRKEYQDYTLKRLIKGLTSPRDFARQGFATSLCEVLRIFPYSLQDVLSVLDENTQVYMQQHPLIECFNTN